VRAFSQEEIFGPVLVANTFSDEAEAIALANQTQFGLGASVWTNDVNRIHRLVPAVNCWNCLG